MMLGWHGVLKFSVTLTLACYQGTGGSLRRFCGTAAGVQCLLPVQCGLAAWDAMASLEGVMPVCNERDADSLLGWRGLINAVLCACS